VKHGTSFRVSQSNNGGASFKEKGTLKVIDQYAIIPKKKGGSKRDLKKKKRQPVSRVKY